MCSHHSSHAQSCSAQLPSNGSAAGDCPASSAHAENICTHSLPAGTGTARGPPLLMQAESHHGPCYAFASRHKPKVLQDRDHYKSFSALEGSIRSMSTISAPGCSPCAIWLNLLDTMCPLGKGEHIGSLCVGLPHWMGEGFVPQVSVIWCHSGTPIAAVHNLAVPSVEKVRCNIPPTAASKETRTPGRVSISGCTGSSQPHCPPGIYRLPSLAGPPGTTASVTPTCTTLRISHPSS